MGIEIINNILFYFLNKTVYNMQAQAISLRTWVILLKKCHENGKRNVIQYNVSTRDRPQIK